MVWPNIGSSSCPSPSPPRPLPPSALYQLNIYITLSITRVGPYPFIGLSEDPGFFQCYSRWLLMECGGIVQSGRWRWKASHQKPLGHVMGIHYRLHGLYKRSFWPLTQNHPLTHSGPKIGCDNLGISIRETWWTCTRCTLSVPVSL